MKTKNLLMLLAIAGMMVFASCKKDSGTPDPLTKEQATAALTKVSGSFSTDMTAFETDPAVLAANAVGNLSLPAGFDSPFGSGPMKSRMTKENFQQSISKFSKPSSTLRGGGFDSWNFPFADYVGTWSTTGGWHNVPSTPTDQVVIFFSYNEGTDNGKLTYFDYVEKTVSVFGQSQTYMSQLKAKIEIDGVIKSTWTYTSSISGNLTSVNASMTLAQTMGSYSQTLMLSSGTSSNLISGTMTFAMAGELTKDGSILHSVSFNVVMNESETSSTIAIDAKYRFRDIVIKWDINIIQGVTVLNGSPAEYMTVSVWTADGAKVADVVFVQDGDNWVPYFKYADGTQEMVSAKIGADNTEGTLGYELGLFMNSFMNYLGK